MRFTLSAITFALAIAAAPAFAQNAAPAPIDPTTAPADFATLRDTMTAKNRDLTAQLNTQRELIKKNIELLKEARRLDAANRKIQAEQEKVNGRNADLKKQREALTGANQPAAGTSTEATDKKAAPTTNVASR